MNQINTNKLHKVVLYNETEFVVEFFDEDTEKYEYYGYESYVCWIVGDDGEYDKKCVLHVNMDEAYIEIFTGDDEVSDKQMVYELTEVDEPAIPQFKNAMGADDAEEC